MKKLIPNDDELIRLYVEEKMYLKDICRMFGLSPNSSGNLSRKLKSLGVEVRLMKGENHNCWKGGVISKGDNYVGIWNPTHERADKQGYVYEHTLIYEKEKGILPKKNEVLHHIDLDKKNNKIENLYLCGHKKHLVIHRSIEKLIKPLMEYGIVEFNNEEYVLNGIVVDVFAEILKGML